MVNNHGYFIINNGQEATSWLLGNLKKPSLQAGKSLRAPTYQAPEPTIQRKTAVRTGGESRWVHSLWLFRCPPASIIQRIHAAEKPTQKPRQCASFLHEDCILPGCARWDPYSVPSSNSNRVSRLI